MMMWRRSAVALGSAVLACGPGLAQDGGASELGETTGETVDTVDTEETPGDGDGDGEPGDGDGEPGDGDGDGEPGDGDGEPGDGDGEPGDGDGEPPPLDYGRDGYCEFADPYIETEIADELGLDSGPVPIVLAESLMSLHDTTTGERPGEYPASLVGIGCASNLVTISLGGGTVDDLSPLVELEALERLTLINNEVSQLQPLAEHGQLEWLNLGGSPIPDGALTDIAGLPLIVLSVAATDITGLDEILLFEDLRKLSISGLAIDDISPLAGSKIVALALASTEVTDLTPLTLGAWGLDGLGCLDIADTPVTDLSPLLDVDWVIHYEFCDVACPTLRVDTENLDDYSKDVVIPTLCDAGVSVNYCLFCPQ